MQQGHRTWIFDQKPVICSTGVIGGPFEANGTFPEDFDLLHEDLWMGTHSYEDAQRILFEQACQRATEKAKLRVSDMDFLFAGDMMNQMTPTTIAARTLHIPYLGLFSGCATAIEALALGAFVINAKGASYVLTGAASHHTASEKQLYGANEYAMQKPSTAQWTVTGAGAAVVSQTGTGPRVTSATIGKIVDMGLQDPFHLGSAMAPAAVHTIEAHLTDRGIDASYYDLILTGNLGTFGRTMALELLQEHHINVQKGAFLDCGLLLYQQKQLTFAGGMGAGCVASVLYGHILNRLRKGDFNNILVVATAALHSPLTMAQHESIPCIAHAVSIERGRSS